MQNPTAANLPHVSSRDEAPAYWMCNILWWEQTTDDPRSAQAASAG